MALKSSQCYHHQSETERSTEGNDIIKIMIQKITLTWTTLSLLTMSCRLTGPHIYPRHTRKIVIAKKNHPDIFLLLALFSHCAVIIGYNPSKTERA